jgi:hypothetical protein
MSKKTDFERKHPPPPGEKYLKKIIKVSFRIEQQLLDEKMRLAGYKNRSQFLREIVKDSDNSALRSQVENINEKIEALSNLLSDNIILKKTKIKNYQPPQAPIPSGPPKRSSPSDPSVSPEKKAALEMIAEMKYKINNLEDGIQSILEPVPKEELEKEPPKTDRNAFHNFKQTQEKCAKT